MIEANSTRCQSEGLAALEDPYQQKLRGPATPLRRAMEILVELGLPVPPESILFAIVSHAVQAQTLLFSVAMNPPDANSLDRFFEALPRPEKTRTAKPPSVPV